MLPAFLEETYLLQIGTPYMERGISGLQYHEPDWPCVIQSYPEHGFPVVAVCIDILGNPSLRGLLKNLQKPWSDESPPLSQIIRGNQAYIHPTTT
jgi:hypothetical protein